MRRRPPTASAGPVGRQSQTARRNAGSVSPTISEVTRPARTRQRRRRASASSTWSSSRPRSTAPSRRAAPRRTSSPPTRRSRPSTTTRSSTTSTSPLRASWPINGPHSPTRYSCRQRRRRLLSAARDRTGWNGQGSVETPGAGPDQALRPAWGRHPRRVASRRGPSTTTRCGWFQRWR